MNAMNDILTSLEDKGWAICDGLIQPNLTHRLFIEGQQRWEQGQFHHARIGRDQQLAQVTSIRGDSILWLEPDRQYPASQEIFQLTGLMQQALNRYFFLGIKHMELHYARYTSGTGYARHLDQHNNTAFRKITFVTYLNPEWTQADGGELVLYNPVKPTQEIQRILPIAGRTVIFRSDLIEHEVLPCQKPRWSVTGWFRDDERLFDLAA